MKKLIIFLLFVSVLFTCGSKNCSLDLNSNRLSRVLDDYALEAVIKKYKNVDVSYSDLRLHIMTGSELTSNVPKRHISRYTRMRNDGKPTFYGASSEFIKVTKFNGQDVGLYKITMEGKTYDVFVKYSAYRYALDCHTMIDEIVSIKMN